MRILVTGGGGFLGSAICRQLADRGHDVLAFQRSPADHLAAVANIRCRPGDICDISALRHAAEDCDAVIHTAGKAGIWGDPDAYHRVNVGGSSNVAEACRESGITLLVHTSSPSIVHSGGDISGGDETLPIARHFKGAYPRSKARAEELMLAANSENLRVTALRPHLIWGPGDPHFLPRLKQKARRGTLALPAPDKLVDTTFVENAALAHVLALEELSGAARCAGKAYFITNNEPLPQGEIIRKLLAAIGMDVRIKAVPVTAAMTAAAVCETAWKLFRLQGEPPVTRFSVEQLTTAHWFDTSAARRDFGYTPTVTIAEGLDQLRRSATP